MKRNEGHAAGGRFVHLGERLATIERIRAGTITPADAAAELDVDKSQVLRWMELHGNERLVSLDDLRGRGDDRSTRLAARARRLATLLAAAERHVHALHLELLSKKFGEKPQRDFTGVSRAQLQGE